MPQSDGREGALDEIGESKAAPLRVRKVVESEQNVLIQQ
jgi:hypothetical protein